MIQPMSEGVTSAISALILSKTGGVVQEFLPSLRGRRDRSLQAWNRSWGRTARSWPGGGVCRSAGRLGDPWAGGWSWLVTGSWEQSTCQRGRIVGLRQRRSILSRLPRLLPSRSRAVSQVTDGACRYRIWESDFGRSGTFSRRAATGMLGRACSARIVSAQKHGAFFQNRRNEKWSGASIWL